MQSIFKISLLIKNGHDSSIVIGNYLDEFKNALQAQREVSVKNAPDKGIGEKAAYLAALVEQLCLIYEIELPAWTNDTDFFLKHPIFYSSSENLKAVLIQESPASFRRRNI